MLAYSGFRALNDYVGRPDLFGRPFTVSQADVAGGLAAATVLQMGEGAEQTPIAVLTELPFVQFQDRDLATVPPGSGDRRKVTDRRASAQVTVVTLNSALENRRGSFRD